MLAGKVLRKCIVMMHSHSCDYGKCYFLRVKHISWQSADICALSKISLFIFTSYIVKLKLHFLHKKIRSSHDMFYRKRFSQPEACNFIKKGTLTQVFSCEFCEISKNTFFTEHIWATASEKSSYSHYNNNIELTAVNSVLNRRWYLQPATLLKATLLHGSFSLF